MYAAIKSVISVYTASEMFDAVCTLITRLSSGDFTTVTTFWGSDRGVDWVLIWVWHNSWSQPRQWPSSWPERRWVAAISRPGEASAPQLWITFQLLKLKRGEPFRCAGGDFPVIKHTERVLMYLQGNMYVSYLIHVYSNNSLYKSLIYSLVKSQWTNL